MKKKTFLALLLTLSMSMFALAGCGGGGDEQAADGDKEASSDVVVVGTNPVFEPFEYQDDEGNMKGFDLDLLTAIGEDQGFDVEFKSLEFDALTAALQTGEIDAAAAGVSVTPERYDSVLFSDPYMDASLGVVVDSDNDTINTIEDLTPDMVIGAQIGTTGAEAAADLEKEGKIKEAKLLADFSVCVQELKTGGVNAVINDMPVNQAYLEKHPGDVRILDEAYETDYYAIMLAKDNTELQEKINAGLKNVIESGRFAEICEEYELPVPESIVNGDVTIESILAAKKGA